MKISRPAILSLRETSFSFYKKSILTEATLHLYAHDKCCLIGRNGSGKSTLLKLLSGLYEPDAGVLFIQPGLRIGYLAQQISHRSHSVSQFIQQALPQDMVERQSTVAQIESILQNFGIPLDKTLEALSGGEERRVALVTTLYAPSDLCLLDEPTNHLDIGVIEWLENWIQTCPKAFLIVSHDRTFLKNVTSKTIWLEGGHLYTCPYGFKQFEGWQETFLMEQERALEKMDTKLAQEMGWLHKGVTARRRRNQGRLQRLKDLREKRNLYLRQQKKDLPAAMVKNIPEMQQLMEVKDLSYKTPEGRLLFENFSFRLLKGDRIGVIGPNGCGKSTLIRLLLGELPLQRGTIKCPKNLTYGFFSQDGSLWEKPQDTLWQFLCPEGGDHLMVQGKHRHVVAYLKEFLFSPDQIRSPMAFLSGGECNRLRLAKILAETYPLLILDEPTNDLDIETLDFLQDFLMGYPGTLFIVSHDRDFLDNVATSLLIFETKGLTEYVGSFTEYIKLQNHQLFFSSGLKNTKQAVKQGAKQGPFLKKQSEKRPNIPTKLSYKDVYRLENIPRFIETLHQEKEQLHQQMLKAHEDFVALNPLAQRVMQITMEIETLEEEWLELLEKQDQLEDKKDSPEI